MNANFFTFDFFNSTIVGSKTAIKRAGNPASAEYKELVKMKREQPTFAIVEKEIKKKANKTTYKGLSFEVIENYIETIEEANRDKYREQYNRVKSLGYPTTKKWFLDNFKDTLNMKEAKKTVAKVKIRRACEAA